MYCKDHQALEKDCLGKPWISITEIFKTVNQKSVIKGLNIGDPAYIISQTTLIPILPFTKRTIKNLSDSENALPYSHTVLPSHN